MLSLEPILLDGQWKTATQLKDDLVIGSFVHAEALIKNGWVCVLLANTAPEPSLPSIKIALIDGTGNDRKRIQSVICWVVKQWKEGKKVAILCRSGANRASAAAAAAMYVAGRASSVYGAIEWMRGQRKEVGHYGGTATEFEFAAAEMVEIALKKDFCLAS